MIMITLNDDNENSQTQYITKSSCQNLEKKIVVVKA